MNRDSAAIKESISQLVDEAEHVAKLLADKEKAPTSMVASQSLPENQVGIIADEIRRFRAEFEGDLDDEIVERTLAHVLYPAIRQWLDENMARITKEVVSQKLDQIRQEKIGRS